MSLELLYGLICVVLAPPAAVFRTLQWDTDPSALQLQADSELGYVFPLDSAPKWYPIPYIVHYV